MLVKRCAPPNAWTYLSKIWSAEGELAERERR